MNVFLNEIDALVDLAEQIDEKPSLLSQIVESAKKLNKCIETSLRDDIEQQKQREVRAAANDIENVAAPESSDFALQYRRGALCLWDVSIRLDEHVENQSELVLSSKIFE